MPELEPVATPAAEPTPSATPAPAISGAPAAAPAISTTPPVSAITEDRSTWVPPHRLRETRESAVREAQQQWAQERAQIQAQYQQVQQQLHALVGVTPQGDPEITNVRQQFAQLYPGLAAMEERSQDLMGILDRAGDLEAQNSHYWQSYGRQSMDRLYDHASQSLGAPLTDAGKRQLHAAFTGYVSSSPELMARYSNDPTLIQEFWTDFTSSFIDPARRVASATVAGRAAGALPQDTPGGAPRATPAPHPANLDERAANAWAQYQATKR